MAFLFLKNANNRAETMVVCRKKCKFALEN